ncbi:hypothetical protein DM02DRAFT_546041, partial [Periconia macrospinosa]
MSLHDFVRFGPHIFLYTPPEYRVGHLIILCTWMGAADKHIDKYIKIYRQQVPTAKILLLRSVVWSMIDSYSSQQRAMIPAQQVVCDILKEHGDLENGSANEKPRILLHMMSNGGVNSATNMLTVLEKRLRAPLRLVGVVCDSAPNSSSYSKTCTAFKHSFSSGFPLNLITTAFIHVVIALLYLWIAVGNEAPEDYWRRSVLDEKMIECKRICYIASKIDKITDWKDVVSHAGEA